MSNVQVLVRRGAAAAVAIALAGILAAGCSTVASNDTLTGPMGALEGVVMSDRGAPATGIQVCAWCDETAGGSAQQYTVTTDGSGSFTIEDIELGSSHAFARTFEICVNCMPLSASSLDTRYGTWTGTASVTREGTTTVTLEIEWLDEPGEPEQYYDDGP